MSPAHRPDTGARFREWTRLLRRELPPVLPVEVRRAKLRDDYGYCDVLRRADETPYKIRIRIDSRLSAAAAFHVLAHEWAHALAWTNDSPRVEHHGPEWGLAMARVWTVLGED